jgi:hypothetical protein
MGELLDAYRADQRAFEQSGGAFNYIDPIELLRDLVALRRAIPSVTLLAADDPNLGRLGYLGYWNWYDGRPVARDRGVLGPPLEEVSATLQLPVDTLQAWRGNAPEDQVATIRRFFSTAHGRQRVLRFVEEAAAGLSPLGEPALSPPEPVEPEPEKEVYIPTRWERMLADDDDDEPL